MGDLAVSWGYTVVVVVAVHMLVAGYSWLVICRRRSTLPSLMM